MTARAPTLLSLLLAGCVPVLTSPETQETGDSSSWVAPENDWGSAEPPASLEGEGWDEGQIIPDVRMGDQNGDEVSLWQFYGSVVVLDLSTMWCAPCRELADEVCAVQTDYADQGFAYLTLLSQNNVGEVPTDEDLVTWATDHEICAPVLRDDQGVTAQVVPDGAFPVLMVLDRDLRVVEDRLEPAEDSTLRALIESLL